MQRLRRALVGTAVACLALPLGIGSAVAHDDDDDDDGDALEVEVLVTGLDGPRGLALDRKDNVYFAQAGRGGPGPCIPGPDPAAPPNCLGDTGKISKLVEDDDDDRHHRRGHDKDDDDTWSVRDVVTGLPSLGSASGEAIGPSDVAFDRRGRAYATIGLGADPTLRTTTLGNSALSTTLATVQRLDLRRGTASLFADIGAFELSDNPEPTDLDSNPHSIAVANGVRYVADAGGNALLKVDRDGVVSLVHAFEPVMVRAPGDPTGPAVFPADPVPNSVVRGPDGAIYVGLLTGFPFQVGAAQVWRFAEGEPGAVYAEGFTNIIDLAFDDDDNLLVLEIAHNGLLGAQTDPTGGLIKVSHEDPTQHTVLLTAPLVLPGGIVVDDDDAYISNQTLGFGAGQILKVELDD